MTEQTTIPAAATADRPEWRSPWDGLGKRVDARTIEQLFMQVPEIGAGVYPEPIYNGAGEVIPDAVANYREATHILTAEGVTAIPKQYVATVSTTYRVIQNREAFGFIADMLHLDEQATVNAAGVAAGGRRCWVSVSLPDDYLIPGEDRERRQRNFLFFNGFDARLSFTVIRTDLRMICMNMLGVVRAQARRDGHMYRVQHTTNAAGRVQEARNVLGMAEAARNRQAVIAERMAETTLPDSVWEELMVRLFPVPEDSQRGRTIAEARRAAVTDIYRTHPSVAHVRGTAWGMLNAVTGWDEHVRNAKPEARLWNAAANSNRATNAAWDFLTDRVPGVLTAA